MKAYLTTYAGQPYGEHIFAPEEAIEYESDDHLRSIICERFGRPERLLHWLRTEDDGYKYCWADELLKDGSFEPYNPRSDIFLGPGQAVRIIGHGREELLFVTGGGPSVPKAFIPIESGCNLSEMPEKEYFVVLPFGKTVTAILKRPEGIVPGRLSIIGDDIRFGPLGNAIA